MLANDAAVDDVFSQETLQAAPPGSVHVNLATVSLDIAQEMTSRHAAAGVGYLAVPVLGRPPVAEQGQLNLLAAGDAELLQSLEPVLTSLGKKTWRFGDRPWQANVAKISMNYLLIHALQAMAEAQALAELHGLDPNVLVDLTSESFFPGPVYSGYGREIAESRYLPAAFSTGWVPRTWGWPGRPPRRSDWSCRPHQYSRTSSVPRSTWAWVSTTGPPSPRSPAAESPPHRHPYLPHRRTES